MPDPKLVAELTALGVVLYLFVWLIQRVASVVERTIDRATQAIENNTVAMTQIRDYVCGDREFLAEHDKRAERIEGGVVQVGRVVDRIEAKLDKRVTKT